MTRPLVSIAALTLVSWFVACSSTRGNTATGATGGAGTSSSSASGVASSGGTGVGIGGAVPGLGAAQFDPGELDAPSDGATITFQQIGATGSFPSVRDPDAGPCDAYDANNCCMTTQEITSDQLTPWDEDLIMTLRGPMDVKQLAVYQPAPSDDTQWQLVSGWDSRAAGAAEGMAFSGDATPKASFAGGVGSECLVNVSTTTPFACGPGSMPYCPGSTSKKLGWAGSKLFVLLASMPRAASSKAAAACSTGTTGNWYDAPWVGLSVGQLVRAGSFSFCQCYAKDPTKGYLADGCGQFNVFEVVNDNNQYQNFDVFSTDMIDYAGYVGQGPCGPKCSVAALPEKADLIDKTNDTEATAGAVATPKSGPSAAFRRPETGYRYFVIALDVGSRTVQLGIVHPQNVPASIGGLLPALPSVVPRATVDAVLALRLPK